MYNTMPPQGCSSMYTCEHIRELTSVMGDGLSMGRFPVIPADLHLMQLF